MATFQDLVAEAMPTLEDGRTQAVEGKSWEFYAGPWEVLDDAGEFSEVDLAGCDAEWVVLDDLDGTPLLTLTAAVTDDNQVKGVASPDETAGLGGDSRLGRRCPWYLTLTDGTRKLSVFDPQDSVLVIKQGE